ncbi:MAG TPA: hypothetical protein VIY29_29465 [Ktedonobacteraceae bacterium]
MSRQFVAGKLKGEERKAIIQEVQKHMQEAALRAIKPLLTEFCEEELDGEAGSGETGTQASGRTSPRDGVAVWEVWLPRCEPLHARWALSAGVRDGLGAYRGTASADGGVPMLRA